MIAVGVWRHLNYPWKGPEISAEWFAVSLVPQVGQGDPVPDNIPR